MYLLVAMIALTQVSDFEAATVRIQTGSFCCSGTIIAYDAPGEDELYVLTCAHEFRDVPANAQIKIYSPHQKFHTLGKLIWIDHPLDVAIISFRSTRQLTGVKVAEKRELQIGERVTAVGFPNAIYRTVKRPTTVKSTHRYFNRRRVYETTTYYPSQQGMSGGPLVDMNGELVGILSASNNEETWFVSLTSIYKAIK